MSVGKLVRGIAQRVPSVRNTAYQPTRSDDSVASVRVSARPESVFVSLAWWYGCQMGRLTAADLGFL